MDKTGQGLLLRYVDSVTSGKRETRSERSKVRRVDEYS